MTPLSPKSPNVKWTVVEGQQRPPFRPPIRSRQPPMRILVVEDEPRIARLLTSGLQAEGFVVDAVSDGGVGHPVDGEARDRVRDPRSGAAGQGRARGARAYEAERPETSVLILCARRDAATSSPGCGAGRRLHHQTVLVRRARRAHPDPQRAQAASGRRRGTAGGRELDTRARSVDIGVGSVQPDRPRVPPARVPAPPPRPPIPREPLLSAVWGDPTTRHTNVVTSDAPAPPEDRRGRVETVRNVDDRLAE